MNIISIDQSLTCTAYCYFQDSKLQSFGCIKTDKTTGDLYSRCKKISLKLKQVLKNKLLETPKGQKILCAREGIAFGAAVGNSGKDLAYLAGMIDLSIGRPQTIAPTALKKYATGKGRFVGCQKQPMIDALPKEVRDAFADQNFKKTTGLSDLADAYFIGDYFLKTGPIGGF